jgi:hypothetical protein
MDDGVGAVMTEAVADGGEGLARSTHASSDAAQMVRDLLARGFTKMGLARALGVSENGPAHWLAGFTPRPATFALLVKLWQSTDTPDTAGASLQPEADVVTAVTDHWRRVVDELRAERDALLFIALDHLEHRQALGKTLCVVVPDDPRLDALVRARVREATHGLDVNATAGAASA